MERNQRRPPDVEEALSSMLWTPYEHTPTDSSSDEDEKLNIKLKKSKTNFEHNNNNNNNINNNNLNNINNNFPNQQYVPLNRKLERYDNFRFSYPYYGPVPTVQKCITELPSYESLYQNITPVLTNITTGLNGRLVHSFTDNFITQNQSGNMPISENGTTIFITNSEHFTDTGSIAEISSSSSTSIGQMQVSSVSECSNNELLCMNQIKNVTKTNHDHFLNFELWQQNDNNSGGDLLIGHACNNDDDDDDDDGDEDDDNHDFRNSTNIEQLQNYNSSRENQLQTNDAATTTNQYNISATNKNVTSKIEIHNYNRNNNNTNNGNQSILPGDRGGDHDDDDENFLGVSKLREENNMSSCSIVSRDFDIDQRMTIPTTATATTPPILPWNILKNGVCKTVVEEYEKQETSCDSSGTGNTFDNNNTGCIAHVKTTEILSNVNSMMAFSSVRNVETVRSTLTDIRNSSFLHSNNNSNDNFGAVSSSCASSFSSSVIRSDNSTDDQILEINSCSNNNNNNNININNNNNKNSENSINIRNFAVNVRNTFLAMRLNVQGAASIVQTIKNGNNTNFNSNIRNTITNNTMTTITPTTTSVFLPITDTTTTNVHNNNNNNINSNNNNNNNNNVGIIRRNYNISSNGTHMGAIVQPQPSLTIQVNQINENHSSSSEELSNIINHDQQISRNLVNQSISTTTTTTGTSGISVVNCYSNSNLNNINNNSSSVVPHPNNINSVNNFISINNNTNTNNINNNNEYRDVNIIVPNIIKTNSNDNNIGKCLNNNSFSGRNDIIINNNNNINNNGLPIASTTVSRLSTSLENNGNTITTTNNNNNNRGNRTNERTFTSTESQTDDLIEQTDIINSNSNDNNISPSNMIHQNQTDALISREQRRRERRERRQQGRTTRHPHIIPPPPPPVIRPILPDILHSHYPPPYTALTLTNHPPPPPPPSSLITPVISTVPIATTVNDGRFTIPLPVIRRSPSERSGKGCCGQWFAGPPLRALIAVVALGGVACALGGAALGATGLAGPPTSHLTAALLMIGVGVILVTVSGAAWRMTAPGGPPCLGLGSTVDLGRCGRRPCNSRGAPHGLLYPEFQHRPPPPSYQASMQEYRLRLLLLDRDRQNGVVRGSSPPPTYRSHAGSLLRAPLSTATTQSTRNGHSGNGSIGGNNSIGGPGSEYSLPPSYRSRNPNNILNNTNNNNNLSSSRPPTSFGDGESMESLGSNIYNTLSSLGNLPENHNDNNINHISRTSIEQQHRSRTDEENDINMISTMTNNTTTTKEQPDNNMDKVQHRDGATKIKTPIKIHNYNKNPNIESQNHNNYNEKLNPRVINNNNNLNINNNNDNIINNSDSCMNLSPSSKNLTTQATNCEQSSVGMKNTRKELVTIVTISSNNNNNNNNSNTNQNSEQSSEMEILAHL